MEGEAGEIEIMGIGLTTREIVFVLVHPIASTPVTEYVVVTAGETVIEFEIVPPGFQV